MPWLATPSVNYTWEGQKIVCNSIVGNTITFDLSNAGVFPCTLYIDGNSIETGITANTYDYTFNTTGTYSVYFRNDDRVYSYQIEITVKKETTIWDLPSDISSIYIGQKEIQTIERVSDGAIIYQRIEPHNYVLTASLNPSTILSSGSTTIYGTLTDNGSPMANKTITIYDGNTSLGTCTTDSNGAYSKVLSGFHSGTHTLKASHINVDSSNVTLTVNAGAGGVAPK